MSMGQCVNMKNRDLMTLWNTSSIQRSVIQIGLVCLPHLVLRKQNTNKRENKQKGGTFTCSKHSLLLLINFCFSYALIKI